MKSLWKLTAVLSLCAAVSLSACKSDVKVDTDADTLGTARDSGTVGGAIDNAGQETKDESVEKMVEAALVAKPGFENVTVESQPDGVIILNGSVKSENEKAQAQVVAENTTGVKKVTNNLTVAQ